MSARRSKSRKKAEKMFIPRIILEGFSGGSQKTTIVRIARRMHG
jgi:hypothetical protein